MERLQNSVAINQRKLHEVNSSLNSFQQFYLEHFSFVVGNARRFGIQADEAEDVAQDVFTTAFLRRHSVRKGVSGRAWLYGITRRVAAGRRRTKSRRTRKLNAFAEQPAPLTAMNFADRMQAAQIVENFLSQIDKDKQEVFVLAELFDMSGQEIADALGINVSTGASRLRLARASFRKFVAQYDPTQTDHVQATLLANARSRQHLPAAQKERSWTALVAVLASPAALGTSTAFAYIAPKKIAPVWQLSVSLTATFALVWGIQSAFTPEHRSLETESSFSSGCSGFRNKNFERTRDSNLAAPGGSKSRDASSLVQRLSALVIQSTTDAHSATNSLGNSNLTSPWGNVNDLDMTRSEAYYDLEPQEKGYSEVEAPSRNGNSINRIPNHGRHEPGDSRPTRNSISPTESSSLDPRNENPNRIPSLIVDTCTKYCDRLDSCRPAWGNCHTRCTTGFVLAKQADRACVEPFIVLTQCVLNSNCQDVKDYINEFSESYPCKSQEHELKSCKGEPVDQIASISTIFPGW